MFPVAKQRYGAMNESLIQLMTGAIDLSKVQVVYDNVEPEKEEDCVMALVEGQEPIMLRQGDARRFRRWYQAQLAGTGHDKCPASSPSLPGLLNSRTA